MQEISQSSATISPARITLSVLEPRQTTSSFYTGLTYITHYPWAVRQGYLPVKLYF